MEPKVIEYKHKVQYYETDKMGITHHSNYIRWMEEARVNYLHEIGCDYEKLEERGIISPVTRVDVKYKKTTTFPEEVTIRVSAEPFNGLRLVVNYEMINDSGKQVCTATSEHCFLGEGGRIVRMKKECPDYTKMLEAVTGVAE